MIILRQAITLSDYEIVQKYLIKHRIIPAGTGDSVELWMAEEVLKIIANLKEKL